MALSGRFLNYCLFRRLPGVLTVFESKIHLCATLNSTASGDKSPTPVHGPGDKANSLVAESIKRAEELSKKYGEHVDEAVARWSKNNEIYYGKERDLTNFPPIRYSELHPKVRLGFIPDTWFQALYPRTGVTGPYILLFGTSLFLINKEIWVVDAHFIELVVFITMTTFLIKKFAPAITAYMDKYVQEVENRRIHEPLKAVHQHLDGTIAEADEEIARAAAVPLHVQAKEENLDLQLELAYRERLQQVHRAVQRRLDYHVECENTRRRFQQHHMVDWIVNRVISGITPAQEKETLKNCVAELRRLAQTSKAMA